MKRKHSVEDIDVAESARVHAFLFRILIEKYAIDNDKFIGANINENGASFYFGGGGDITLVILFTVKFYHLLEFLNCISDRMHYINRKKRNYILGEIVMYTT